MTPTAITFFSVDVETTSTHVNTGHLLTIGIVPVVVPFADGIPQWTKAEATQTYFHIAIDQTHHYPEWFATLTDPTSTLSWWVMQNIDAQNVAWRDPQQSRYPAADAADELRRYVEAVEPHYWHRVFVANPVSFDYPWVEGLFRDARIESPFPYRTLCLRSLQFGVTPGSMWGARTEHHRSEIPHHALYDARAQAYDLVDLLRQRESLTA